MYRPRHQTIRHPDQVAYEYAFEYSDWNVNGPKTMYRGRHTPGPVPRGDKTDMPLRSWEDLTRQLRRAQRRVMDMPEGRRMV